MSGEQKPVHVHITIRRDEAPTPGEGPDATDLDRRPEAVLSVLEADQLVAAKERARFGQRRLSSGIHVLMWGLRFYVIAMLALVVIQVLNAMHGGH